MKDATQAEKDDSEWEKIYGCIPGSLNRVQPEAEKFVMDNIFYHMI